MESYVECDGATTGAENHPFYNRIILSFDLDRSKLFVMGKETAGAVSSGGTLLGRSGSCRKGMAMTATTATATKTGKLSNDVLHEEPHALDAIFAPKTVAVIGATETQGAVGRTILWNLITNP